MSESREVAYLIFGTILGAISGVSGNLLSSTFYDFLFNGRTDVFPYVILWAIPFISFIAIYWWIGNSLLKKAKNSRDDTEIIKQEIKELNEKIEEVLERISKNKK